VDRNERIAVVVAEVGQIVQEGLEQLWDQALGADLGCTELQLQQVLRRAGGRIVAGLGAAQVAALEEQRPQCAQCGQALRRVGLRPRSLVGLVGDSRVERPYCQCDACQVGVAPLDEVWGLGSGMLTPGLARDGLEVPFGRSVSLVAEHLGVVLDEEVVRSVTERLGALADADQAAGAAWHTAAAQPVPEMLVVELDGGLLHLRVARHELKMGRVAPLGPRVVEDPQHGERHVALGPSLYCAGVESHTDFWPRLLREAQRAGLGQGVKRVVVLADGADWIWGQARAQLAFPGVEVVEILDFYHASQHLAKAAAAAYGAQSEVGKQWLDTQCQLLRHQGGGPVRAAVRELRAHGARARRDLREVRAYLLAHRRRMAYPAFRARLFPLGSGAIESTVKNVMQQRQVLAGMRWTRAGAHSVANLRALHRSVGSWTAFWQSQPLRRALVLLAPPLPVTAADDHLAATVAPHRAAPATSRTVALGDEAPPTARAKTAARIHTEGKPWGKGKGYWGRVPACQKHSA
jgi:ribosomal protein L34E